MKRFITSQACESGAHCKECRDKASPIRKHWSKGYLLPKNKVDFACPFNLPWGWKPGDPTTRPQVITVKGKPCCGGDVPKDTFIPTPSE